MFKYLFIALIVLFGSIIPGSFYGKQQDFQKNEVVYVWESEPNYYESQKVYLDAFVNCYNKIPLDVLKQPSREAMIEWLANTFEEIYSDKNAKNKLWLSAKINDKIVGFLVIDVSKYPEEIYLAQLAIDPVHQKKGIASSMIHSLFDQFSECRRFVVITRLANEEAKNLYNALGFTSSSYMHEGYSPELYTGFEHVNQVFAMKWSEVLEKHKDLLLDKSIVLRQYEAFYKADAPAIADSRIKEIPIFENFEELIDLNSLNCKRIYMMPQPKTPFEGPSFNSGLPNSSKMRRAVFLKLKKMVEELDRIATDFKYKPGQIDILLFEGLRDLTVQKMLFEKKMEEILLLNPHMSNEMAEKETAKWVSPVKDNIPVHSTGAAVDLRLWDNKNCCFLDLGPFGVIWGNCHLAPTFSEGITNKQKENRLFCLLAAERAGLTNYVYEWWHFSFGDRYDVYWKDSQQKVAHYGSIE